MDSEELESGESEYRLAFSYLVQGRIERCVVDDLSRLRSAPKSNECCDGSRAMSPGLISRWSELEFCSPARPVSESNESPTDFRSTSRPCGELLPTLRTTAFNRSNRSLREARPHRPQISKLPRNRRSSRACLSENARTSPPASIGADPGAIPPLAGQQRTGLWTT